MNLLLTVWRGDKETVVVGYVGTDTPRVGSTIQLAGATWTVLAVRAVYHCYQTRRTR
jgi:hypothetical protein